MDPPPSFSSLIKRSAASAEHRNRSGSKDNKSLREGQGQGQRKGNARDGAKRKRARPHKGQGKGPPRSTKPFARFEGMDTAPTPPAPTLDQARLNSRLGLSCAHS